VDATPVVFDASIGPPGSGDVSNSAKDPSSWRTVLIGSMRFGGASKSACTKDLNFDGVIDRRTVF